MWDGLGLDPSAFGAGEIPSGSAEPPTGVDDGVQDALSTDGQADVIIRLSDQADLAALGQEAEQRARSAADAERRSRATPHEAAEAARAARAMTVVEGLRTAAERSQGRVRAVLDEHAATNVTPFWIFNGIAATIDADTLDDLADHPDVASVTLDAEITLDDPIEEPGDPLLPTWSLEHVNAPDTWGEYGIRGDGVVVGIMDSGVDGDHPALAASWRGNNGGDVEASWWVGTGENYPEPGDGHGHGTHVAGSIVGSAPGEITGVAPDAEWIAAKIFRDGGSTSESIIHAAFEWMLAPGGDPAAAPHVVNNSWGADAPNLTTFWADVEAWVAAGIVPMFANGNNGPAPGSVGSPGSFPHAIGVGATDIDDVIASFSSRGPVIWDGETYIKPQVSAPGQQIRSTWPTRLIAEGYRTISGTSMATPHATGVVALMLSADRSLGVDEVREHLQASARVEPHMGAVPNNRYGSGIVDAFAAVTRVAFSGTLTGTITGPDGPVEATVSVAGRSATSDPGSGEFELAVPEGNHELTVSAYGFATYTATVTIIAGESTTADIVLATVPSHRLTGTVNGPGGPIEHARVVVEGAPLPEVRTDPDGRFELTVAAGSHTLLVTAAGHVPERVDVEVDGPRDVDIALDRLNQPSDAGWNQYQNNSHRTGLGGDSVAPESLEASWTAQAGSNTVFASPVLAGNAAFIGSDGGRLLALDAATGTEKWRFTTGSNLRGAPAVADGVVFTGGGQDGGLYALDAATGQVRWTLDTPDRSTIYTAPAVVDGVVYAATGPTSDREDTVFAVDAATGEALWATDVGSAVFAGPAVGDGLVVVGNAGSGELVALDVATGDVKWTYGRDDDYFVGGPSLADGTVYIATTDGDGGGSVLAIEAATGELRWENARHGDGQGSTPALYGDLVIVGSHGLGAVVAYDAATGEPAWRYDVDGAVSASVMVTDDGYVIGGSQLDHRLWALDAATGELAWEEHVGANVTSSAAFADNRLVTADTRGNIHAFHPTGTVSGIVTGPDGAGLAATITVAETGASVTAGDDGGFELRDLPGRVTLTASLFGYSQESVAVEIRVGRTVTADFSLTAVGNGAVSGTVVDEAGAPIAGAIATLAGTPLEPVTTGAEGDFGFPAVSAGTYRLTVDADGYAEAEQQVSVAAGETTAVQVTLERFDIAVVADYEGRVADVLEDAGWRVDRVSFDEIDGTVDRYRAVVVSGMGDDRADADLTRFGRLVADADDAGTSLVFLDTGGPSYGSIRTLSQVTGNPAGDTAVLSNRGAVWLEDVVPHPITASLSGERVPLLASGSWHAAFSGYTGYTLATIGNDRDGRIGAGVGYQRRTLSSNHILLSAAAPSPWTTWEPAVADLLVDAVDHAASAEYGAAGGVVTDGAGAPIPAAVEVVGGFEAATADGSGGYELILEPGEVTLRFRHLGSQTVERTVTVVAGEKVTLDVALPAAAQGTIAGQVTDASRGTPVAGATVGVTGTGLPPVTTGADGRYVVEDVPAGVYDVEFAASGYEPLVVSDVVAANGVVTTQDAQLARAPAVVVVGDRNSEITTFLEDRSIPAEQAGWEVTESLEGVSVVILHNPPDPGRDAFLAALDAFDEAGVSVIFLADGWSTRTRGVDLLSRYTGSPSGYGRLGGISGPPIFLHNLADHPLFDGVDGDPVQLLNPSSEAAYFPDYNGIALADVAAGSADPAGIGIAYDVRTPTSVHLLLTGLASTFRNVPESSWTEDGKQIFLNAVRWAAAPAQGGVTGTVTNHEGQPIPNAIVEVAGSHWRAVTDENGAFEIGVPPGEHTLEYRAFGYVGMSQTLTVGPDQMVDASVTLGVGDVGAIAGVVRSSNGGALEGVRVDLRGTPYETVTGPAGEYSFALVEEGSYELELEMEGHVRTLSPVSVTTGQVTTHDVELRVSPVVGVIDDSDFSNSRDRAKEFLVDWGYQAEDIGFDSLDRIRDLDLVVANVSDFGLELTAEQFQAFEEAVNRAGVPVLWMGQHQRGAIRFLNEHTGDPGIVGEGFNDGPVTATVVEDHPLVAGLPDQFDLMVPNGRYTFFDDFGGTTVATLSTSDGPRGATIAYRGRTVSTVDVQLSTMTASTWGAPSTRQSPSLNWTPAAERVYVNALAWALDARGLGAEVRGSVRSDRDGPVPSEVEVVETGRRYAGRAGDGTFLVPLQPGTWTLEVSSFGHATETIEVTVAAGQSVSETVTLSALPAGSVTGTITGPDGGPVAGADVRLVGTPLSGTSAASGGYLLDNVPEGDWTLRINADGFRAAELPVTVVAGVATRVDVQLKATAPVAIVDTTGSSTPGLALADLIAGEGYQVEMVNRANLAELAGRIDDFELVIFNSTLLSSQLAAFGQAVEAADAAGVSAIIPGQWGGYALGAISNLRGDPAEVSWGFVPDGVDYVAARAHPIFSGLPVGEPIELLTNPGQNQQWASYSGWSGETLAAVHARNGGADLGEAVGYRFTSATSVELLLGGLAATSPYGYPGERWTASAEQIYLNAVAWAIDATQAELTGVVSGDGQPLAGATVTAVETGAVAVTGVDGHYALGLPGGTHTIRVEAHGFATHTEVIELPEQGSVQLDFDLARLPRGSVAGTVTSVEGGPVAGAEIEASGPMEWSATTGESGEYAVGDLLEGSYDVTVTADGYLPAEASVTVVAETSASLDVTLQPLNVGVLGDVDMTLTDYLRDAGVAAASLEWGDDVSAYGAIVVNGGSPDEGTFEAFLDAADTAEVSLIFTGTWGVDRGGVRLLERYTDRVVVGAQGYGDGPVVLSGFDQSRALFAGLSDPAGLVVDGGYYSVLESYAGEPLASLSVARDDGPAVTGLSAGWDRRTSGSVEIVLSSSAVTEVQGPGRGWTADAGRLLVNAVEWAEFVSGASWDTAGEGEATTVMLSLAGSAAWPPPADSATLVIVDAETGAEVVRRRMTWAGLFYVATVRPVGAGPYLVGAEVVIDGVRFDLPGPLLSP
jgi:outer membrane protein assembly factor BamB/subtilisin family serine protease